MPDGAIAVATLADAVFLCLTLLPEGDMVSIGIVVTVACMTERGLGPEGCCGYNGVKWAAGRIKVWSLKCELRTWDEDASGD